MFCILCVASDVKLLTSLCQWEWIMNQFWVRQDWLIDFHILVKIWRHKSMWEANACPTYVLKSYEFSLECYKMFCHSLCCTSGFLFLAEVPFGISSYDCDTSLCNSISSNTPLCWSADQTVKEGGGRFWDKYRHEWLFCWFHPSEYQCQTMPKEGGLMGNCLCYCLAFV